jgi:hypothetical protein
MAKKEKKSFKDWAEVYTGGVPEPEPVPDFKDYAEAQAWISKRLKKFKHKNDFYASEEYKRAYPRIVELQKTARTSASDSREAEMLAAGIRYGDRVGQDIPPAFVFGSGVWLQGTVVKHKGFPQVKLDEAFQGRRFVAWNKKWTKLYDPPGLKTRLMR